jgi:chemotaxis protein MotB
MARGKAHRQRFTPSRASAQGEGEKWVLTYGDLVTLLMCFFIMLYAMSQIDQAKFDAFLAGLAVPFENAHAAPGMMDANVAIVAQEGYQPDPSNPVPRDLAVGLDQAQPDQAPDDAPDEPEAPDEAGGEGDPPPIDHGQLEQIRQAIAAALHQEGLDNIAEFRIDERGLVISVATDDVLFATGSTEIGPIGRKILAAIAPELRDFSNDILIEGHTDDVPLTRPGYTNWNLSTDRAVAVLTLLYRELEVPQHRLVATGYGEFRPQVPNEGREQRSQNRRVEIVIVAEGA